MYNAFESEKPAPLNNLFDQVFNLGRVGYVAAELDGEVYMQAHPKLETATTPESNFFEETLVNPSVLNLLRRRGEIDCGGVRYFAVGYGDFVQLILPYGSGHLSIGVDSNRDVPALAGQISNLIEGERGLRQSGECGQNGHSARKSCCTRTELEIRRRPPNIFD